MLGGGRALRQHAGLSEDQEATRAAPVVAEQGQAAQPAGESCTHEQLASYLAQH